MATTEFPPAETPQAYLERVLATWVVRLRLTHWEIDIVWGAKALDGEEANVSVDDNYDVAHIKVSSSFTRWSKREANVTIVHELVHVMQRGIDCAVNGLEARMKTETWDVWLDRYDHEKEGLTERTAQALVDLGGVV